MGHWVRARGPARWRGPWPARFLGLGPRPGPMAHDVGPMSYGLVLCPMALAYVLRPCPMSYGPVQVAGVWMWFKFGGPKGNILEWLGFLALDQIFVPSHLGPSG